MSILFSIIIFIIALFIVFSFGARILNFFYFFYHSFIHKNKIKLKNTPGPSSSLKEFPLLYCYFDDYQELQLAWRNHWLMGAIHDDVTYYTSMEYAMESEAAFLNLYRRHKLIFELLDGTRLSVIHDKEYWEKYSNPRSLDHMEPEESDSPVIKTLKAYHKEQNEREQKIINAMKIRFSSNSANNDETHTSQNDSDKQRDEFFERILAEKPKNCPKCSGMRIAYIMYGNIIVDDEIIKLEREGTVAYGGCCVTDNDPKWKCMDCSCTFMDNGKIVAKIF